MTYQALQHSTYLPCTWVCEGASLIGRYLHTFYFGLHTLHLLILTYSTVVLINSVLHAHELSNTYSAAATAAVEVST